MNFPSPFLYVLYTLTNNLLKQNEALETYWHISVNIIWRPLKWITYGEPSYLRNL
jgi:hypothetical protein